MLSYCRKHFLRWEIRDSKRFDRQAFRFQNIFRFAALRRWFVWWMILLSIQIQFLQFYLLQRNFVCTREASTSFKMKFHLQISQSLVWFIFDAQLMHCFGRLTAKNHEAIIRYFSPLNSLLDWIIYEWIVEWKCFERKIDEELLIFKSL